MADSGQRLTESAADKPTDSAGKADVKILMLHGYTQSGPLFRAKTRGLEKLLQKHLAPLNLQPVCLWPTAPNRLRLADIPGYQPAAADDEHGTETDSWAWFRKDEASGAYRFFSEGMTSLASFISGVGGVDGVVGFSQGGALAALLAAALEVAPSRPVPTTSHDGRYDSSWVEKVRSANGGRPLRFATVYSGFYAPVPELQWLYEPHIRTPTLHFLGSLDTVVDEGRSRALVARCVDPLVVVHPGGHYVPVSKEWVAPLVGFVRKWCSDAAGETEPAGDSSPDLST